LQSWREVAPLWFGEGQVPKEVLPVAVVVGETYAMAMAMAMMMIVMVMISHRRMNDLFHLYL